MKLYPVRHGGGPRACGEIVFYCEDGEGDLRVDNVYLLDGSRPIEGLNLTPCTACNNAGRLIMGFEPRFWVRDAEPVEVLFP